MNFDLRTHTILLTVSGSRAYGMATATSDVDVKGVAIPPKTFFHGYLHRFDQADKATQVEPFTDLLNPEEQEAVRREKIEGTVFDVRKFIALATDANPNILDVIFCRDEEVRLQTPLGRMLRENRGLFISAKAKHTFSGYAHAQLKRIRSHREWLLHPVDQEPTREEYGLPETTLVPADQLGAAEAAVRKKIDSWAVDYGTLEDAEKINITNQIARYMTDIEVALRTSREDAEWLAAARHVGLDENFIDLMHREKRYNSARVEWKQYQNWKKTRNEARADLEAKYGYDTKHGAHLVRLLRMGREIMATGKVHVWRGAGDGPNDREELLAIRKGEWDYDRLVAWADAEDAALEEAYKTKQYVVPNAPDRNAINDLCEKMVEQALNMATTPKVIVAGTVGTINM